MNEDASPHQQNAIYEWFISRRVAAKHASSYQQVVPLTLTDAQQRRNRIAMLNRVRSYRINGVLDPSLSGIPLALGLRERSDMVTGSLYRDVDEEGRYSREVSAGTPMLQVYTDANGELLILGESGSGKTTLLLELACDLLERATRDETHPIPVVFDLSSWALKRQPLNLWLVEQLKHEYMVPRKLAVSWVENDQILPLLDGLDEVAAIHRESCVEEINTYHREHGLVPLVVSCRSADYDTLQTRLQLYSTVEVQPLKKEQVDDYLTSVGEQANELRLVLQKDSVLQDLATTPLMLNILRQAYQDKQIEDLISIDALDTQRHRILADYVQRKLQPKQKRKLQPKQQGRQMRYQQPQMAHWLSWLARQLALRSQTEFSIEHIQPDWLLEQQGRRVYDYLGVRLPGVLFGIAVSPIFWIASSSINDARETNSLYYIILVMFIGGLIGGLFSEPTEQPFERSLIPSLFTGMFIALVAALLYRLNTSWNRAFSGGGILGIGSFLLSMLVLNGFVGRVNTEISQVSTASGSLKALWSPLLKAGHLRNGIVVGLIYGLAFWLGDLLRLSPHKGFPDLGDLTFGLILGISGIILSAILGGRERTVQPVEVLAWSWSDFKRSLTKLKHLRNGVLIGATCGFMCWPSSVPGPGGIREGLAYVVGDGLAVGLAYWLFAAFLEGVSGTTLHEHHRAVPNQGIRRSVRNGLFMGLIGACVSGVFAFLAVVLRDVLSNQPYNYVIEGLIAALIVGLAGGLIVGLLNGWLAYIRHRVLRVLLLWAGVIPPNYTSFLEEAAARSLLHKAGSSYRFIHKILLDYFAKQETEESKDPVLVNS